MSVKILISVTAETVPVACSLKLEANCYTSHLAENVKEVLEARSSQLAATIFLKLEACSLKPTCFVTCNCHLQK